MGKESKWLEHSDKARLVCCSHRLTNQLIIHRITFIPGEAIQPTGLGNHLRESVREGFHFIHGSNGDPAPVLAIEEPVPYHNAFLH